MRANLKNITTNIKLSIDPLFRLACLYTIITILLFYLFLLLIFFQDVVLPKDEKNRILFKDNKRTKSI